MAECNDLPREFQVEVIKFAVADILQDHIDRVPIGVYWGAYPDYIAHFDSGFEPDITDRDDPDYDYDYEKDMYTELGDGCDHQESHEGSRLISLLVVSKTFLTANDLKHTLLRCGHVSCPSPQYLSQFKDGYTSKKRQEFRVMWIRPQKVPLVGEILPIFGPNNTDLSLFRCLLYFPNLKLINLQLEQYVKMRIDLGCEDTGRLIYFRECQDIISFTFYKNSERGQCMQWIQDLITSSMVLQGKVELRISFEADGLASSYGEGISPTPAAVFSSKDFCVRVQYEGQQWVVKQPDDERYHREKVLEQGKRSSFKGLPRGVQALIKAKARDQNGVCGIGENGSRKSHINWK